MQTKSGTPSHALIVKPIASLNALENSYLFSGVPVSLSSYNGHCIDQRSQAIASTALVFLPQRSRGIYKEMNLYS
jgi:hypothetical protein